MSEDISDYEAFELPSRPKFKAMAQKQGAVQTVYKKTTFETEVSKPKLLKGKTMKVGKKVTRKAITCIDKEIAEPRLL